jgi:F-type H+-transporting ATPase subunit b
VTYLALAESSIQLVPDGTIFIHLLFVIVMVGVLNLTLLKPINRILAERERRGGGRLADAARISQEAATKLQSWERGLREARNEAYRLSESARADALRDRESQVAELKAELSSLVAQQTGEIRNQEKNAQAALMLESKRLAELISSQILGRSVHS